QRPTTKDQPGGCSMCLAIPGKIVEISGDNADAALVEVVGVRRRIDLGLLQDDRPVPGDWVLIHVGFAMSKISECDALDQMNTLRALGEIDGAMQEVQGYGLEDADDVESDDVETAELKISDADLN
ncbi:MAG: HypC/HybG/HupF family hydrogenase formation chaperone, partial [Terriglobales bacterium]